VNGITLQLPPELDSEVKRTLADDLEVLAARKRRALRVHLRGPLDAALRKLREAIDQAAQ